MNYSSLFPALLALISLFLPQHASAVLQPPSRSLLILYSGNVQAELGPCG